MPTTCAVAALAQPLSQKIRRIFSTHTDIIDLNSESVRPLQHCTSHGVEIKISLLVCTLYPRSAPLTALLGGHHRKLTQKNAVVCVCKDYAVFFIRFDVYAGGGRKYSLIRRNSERVSTFSFEKQNRKKNSNTERFRDANQTAQSCFAHFLPPPTLPRPCGQAWPSAVVADSSAGKTAATRDKNDSLERLLAKKKLEVDAYRQQAEEREKKLKLVTVSSFAVLMLVTIVCYFWDAQGLLPLSLLLKDSDHVPVDSAARDAHLCASSKCSAAENTP